MDPGSLPHRTALAVLSRIRLSELIIRLQSETHPAADIAAAVGLDCAQLHRVFEELDLSTLERDELACCTHDVERFCLLWRHLPLPDAVIAKLMGFEQQQVVNRRMLALRELARLVGHRPQPRA